MMIRIQGKLPKNLMDELKACDGVTFTKDGVDLDPLVQPNFGPWFNPYVGLEAQGEVHGLLETYRPLTAAANFNTGVFPPFALGTGPFYQYNHSRIALHAVQAEIENPTQYLANCPILAGMIGGNTICDLQMNYANCAVVLRLRKF